LFDTSEVLSTMILRTRVKYPAAPMQFWAPLLERQVQFYCTQHQNSQQVMSPGFAPVQLRSHRYFILENIVLCKPNPFWPKIGKRHPTRRSRRHTTDKDMRLSRGESQSVLSSRMCPSGWTYQSALPGKQTKTCASHGVSHRASSLAGCVLLDGPTGQPFRANRQRHAPLMG